MKWQFHYQWRLLLSHHACVTISEGGGRKWIWLVAKYKLFCRSVHWTNRGKKWSSSSLLPFCVFRLRPEQSTNSKLMWRRKPNPSVVSLPPSGQFLWLVPRAGATIATRWEWNWHISAFHAHSSTRIDYSGRCVPRLSDPEKEWSTRKQHHHHDVRRYCQQPVVSSSSHILLHIEI